MVSALPSKRIFLLIIACLIGIGAVSFAVFASKNGQNSKIPANDAALLAVSEKIADSSSVNLAKKALEAASAEDDDNDGLMNWEETLWGTDSKKADTDGDATKDGEEVKANRNPLKAGPNDKLATASMGASVNTNSGATDTGTNTQTAQLSRELFANYIAAKQSGETLDADTQAKIIEQTFGNKSLVAPAKVYSTSDIKISASGDLKTYGNTLGAAFHAGNKQSTEDEIEILQKALASGSGTEIAKLDPIIFDYTAILQKIIATPVPQTYANTHLELVNNLSKVLTDVKGFRGMFDDPIVGLMTVGNYYKDIELMRTSVENIKNIFSQNGVTFTQTEYGYVFFQTF